MKKKKRSKVSVPLMNSIGGVKLSRAKGMMPTAKSTRCKRKEEVRKRERRTLKKKKPKLISKSILKTDTLAR